jgi:F420H(2)-dependent quinone reductase
MAAGGHPHHDRGQNGQHPQEPVMRIKRGDTYVAVASNGGASSDPAWYRNLSAHPEVSVQDGAARHRLRAREVRGEEKARWWRIAVG